MYKSMRETFARAMALGPAALRIVLYVYAYAFLVTIAHALPLIKRQKNNKSDEQDSDEKDDITAQTAIGGVVLIIAGLVMCFFGQRTYRITLFLIGLYLGAAISFVALANAEPDDGYDHSQTIFLAAALVAGLLIGAAFAWFSRLATVAVWALGAVTGYLCTLYILGWADNGIIKSKTGQGVLFAIAIILCVAAIMYKKAAMISLFTAFVGAYSLMLGVELFVRTGFATGVRAFSDGRHDFTYDVDKKVYGILGTVEVVFIIGMLVQRRFQPNAFASVDDELPSEGKGKRWWERRWWKRTN